MILQSVVGKRREGEEWIDLKKFRDVVWILEGADATCARQDVTLVYHVIGRLKSSRALLSLS